jgi:hypothetical protein
MNFCGQMIQTSRLGVRCFVPSTRARTVMLAARALSSNFANPAATRRRVEYFGWPLTTTLRLPTNPHRNGGEHTEELVIGRIGFGSPPLGAASERAANLRAALEAGCNWVELDAPLAANDPRLLSLGDPYGEQFLYVEIECMMAACFQRPLLSCMFRCCSMTQATKLARGVRRLQHHLQNRRSSHGAAFSCTGMVPGKLACSTAL